MDEELGAAFATSAGPKAIAAAIVFVGSLRFLKWLAEFVARQLAARADRLEVREKATEHRMDKRIMHLELELDTFREATMKLLNVVAEIAPGHRALSEVARILRKTPPIATLELNELEARLNGLPGRKA